MYRVLATKVIPAVGQDSDALSPHWHTTAATSFSAPGAQQACPGVRTRYQDMLTAGELT